jgi:hypothetical protein
MLTVRNPKHDITVKQVRFLSADYPVKKNGYFKCSDPLLNEIWDMCVRTQSANMEDAYIDCAGRERGMYGRDTIIQYYVNLAAFGDNKLMGRCMELYGQSPDAAGKFRAVYPNSGDYTISDFALNMNEGYLAYYENSGDKKRIINDWDAILNNLAWFHKLADQRQDMLLDSEWHKKSGINAHYGGFFCDRTVPKDHIDYTGIHCAFSCTYLISMEAAIKLAKIAGKNKDAESLLKRTSVLKKSIQKFWDKNKGAFADNLSKNTHSIHSNIMAVRAGVTDKNQSECIKIHLKSIIRSVFLNGYDPSGEVWFSPNFAFYIFDGLYKLGLYDLAENIMRQGWGWMLAQGLKTTAEYFRIQVSLCHAWSASPAYYLSKNILGVNFPKAPNLNHVEIKVNTGSVEHAEGAYPHPKGSILVKWHRKKGKVVFDKIEAPKCVKVRIKKQ